MHALNLKPVALRLRNRLGRLARARSGVAYIEFAYTLPVAMLMGTYGVEASSLAMAHMRISQVALSMADNASRIGQDSALSLTQFRESDVNDTFAAAEDQAGRLDLEGRGRIIMSSIERNAQGGQWIHWQRCFGQGPYDSSYGYQGDGASGTAFAGMGPEGEEIRAPAGMAVMFVEAFYRYEPVISSALFGEPELRYTAAFLVRDERDLSQIFNPAPAAVVAECPMQSTDTGTGDDDEEDEEEDEDETLTGADEDEDEDDDDVDDVDD